MTNKSLRPGAKLSASMTGGAKIKAAKARTAKSMEVIIGYPDG